MIDCIDRAERWFGEAGGLPQMLVGYFDDITDEEIELVALDFKCTKAAALRGLVLLGLEHPPKEFPPIENPSRLERVGARVSDKDFAKVANLVAKQPPGTAMHRIVNGLACAGLKRLEEEYRLYDEKEDALITRMERFGLRDSTINKLLVSVKDLAQLEKIVEDLEEAKKAGAEKGKAR